MTGQDHIEPSELDALAAEYVMGTLDQTERSAVAARRGRDANLEAAIRAWEQRLAPLNDLVAPVAPPAAVWQKIQSQLGTASVPPSFVPATDTNVHVAVFLGSPTLNTVEGTTTFLLAPGGIATVQLGDIFDETGVVADNIDSSELSAGTDYVFRVKANGDGGGIGGGSGLFPSSPYSPTHSCRSKPHDDNRDCVHSQGYWKNHPSAWPVSSVRLGNIIYTKTQALAILNQPAGGNGLVSLAHQLIAAKLNVAAGARVVVFLDSADRPGSGCKAGQGTWVANNNAIFSNPSGDPTAFQIVSYGNTANTTITWDNNLTFTGTLYAPFNPVVFTNNATLIGGVTAKTVTISNNGTWDTRVSSLRFATTFTYFRGAWRQCSSPAQAATAPATG